MTTILNRHIISRWAPGRLNRTMSLDSGLEFRRRDDARLSPGMLFDAESYSSKRADSEGGDASGSMLDTSNFSRKRRCSDSNKDFDLSKRHPRYLERLVEFVFRDIDEHTRLMSYEFSGLPQVNAKLTRRLFAQLSVIGKRS